MTRIGILTSSRADFGIYLPLLKLMKEDEKILTSIIAFGTHLSRFHGFTKDQIIASGFDVSFSIESLLLGDTPEANATSTGVTYLKFSSFWSNHYKEFDVVFCLGDRFEMFAAVYAGVPFGIKFAHIHGGETTLGAIDNIYRHAITSASTYHFTATDFFSDRVKEIIGGDANVYTVGALSLDNLLKTKLLSIEEFYGKWKIDLNKPTILVTFHPETVAYEQVAFQCEVFLKSLQKLANKYQILLTLPNADTTGSYLRQKINDCLNGVKNIFIYENLGTQSYFTVLKYCCMLLGNSSSGIIEAASFNKFVINIGKRQDGRLTSGNVIHVSFNVNEIDDAVSKVEKMNFNFDGKNIYFKKDVARKILSNLINH
jgi:GDP/UDP-N,N'-diacetylbacillosamine 2-epimerase (hydrolysing)